MRLVLGHASSEDEEESIRSDDERQDTSSDGEPSLWFGADRSAPLTPAQQALQRYVESIKGDLDGDFSTSEGVDCKGEPSVDPSRQVQSQGDSEWMDDW